MKKLIALFCIRNAILLIEAKPMWITVDITCDNNGCNGINNDGRYGVGGFRGSDYRGDYRGMGHGGSDYGFIGHGTGYHREEFSSDRHILDGRYNNNGNVDCGYGGGDHYRGPGGYRQVDRYNVVRYIRCGNGIDGYRGVGGYNSIGGYNGFGGYDGIGGYPRDGEYSAGRDFRHGGYVTRGHDDGRRHSNRRQNVHEGGHDDSEEDYDSEEEE